MPPHTVRAFQVATKAEDRKQKKDGFAIEFIKAKDYRNKTNIKMCPFCGENEEIYLQQYNHVAGKRWRIVCASCMAQIDRGHDQTPDVLIDLWNKRI